MSPVTVAIPTRNGGDVFERVMAAVRAQALDDMSLELLVCDSGSTDGSVSVARGDGATVITIRPEEFSHGATRNLLMERAQGEHVVFLTQDAVPADEHWLLKLLAGFSAAESVALVFGPYLPRNDASLMVHHVLAHDMLRAGFAKVFVPDAAVIHSHEYSKREWLRRSLDEAGALHDIYGFTEQRQLRTALLNVWGRVGADVRFARQQGSPRLWWVVLASLLHHLTRAAGTVLRGHAERLPAPVVRRLSLERPT